ncbi:isochorismatase family protein [Streptomyces sp. NPDC057199]|uniref:isochorismatase family protein n=1 Tax=Streptomyces sp. NPDC057199 TaxID=3346047 RepID=UPI003638F376
MTTAEEYLVPVSPQNAAVLFIDNQTNLMLGTNSIDTTLLLNNTAGLASLASIYELPVVLTTTGGGADGPSGALVHPITDTFPNQPIINRLDYLNAMDDPRFAEAVTKTGRKKVILSGLTTDFCLVYPAASLIAAGYHVLIAVDASGSWTKEINDAALQRLIQMGATPTNVQQLAGELQNASAVDNLDASREKHPHLFEWFRRYAPAPALISMNGSYATSTQD